MVLHIKMDTNAIIAATALGSALIIFAIRKWADGVTCSSKAKLTGKTVVITGANTGIGKEAAIDLAKRGAKVIIGCRNLEKAKEAIEDIKKQAGSDLVFVKRLDLSSLASVRQFAASIIATEKRLDILINNAGVMMCPYSKTIDGFETQFGVNHLGHFLLTLLLLDLLKRSAPSRIVTVSSSAHAFGTSIINFDDLQSEKNYSRIGAYGQSKLANVLFTKELHRRLQGTGVTAYVLHPGAVHTDVGRHTFDANFLFYILAQPMRYLLFKSPRQGAQTTIYCAVQEGIEKNSGQYFVDCKVHPTSESALDVEVAKKLWKVSEELVHEKKSL